MLQDLDEHIIHGLLKLNLYIFFDKLQGEGKKIFQLNRISNYRGSILEERENAPEKKMCVIEEKEIKQWENIIEGKKIKKIYSCLKWFWHLSPPHIDHLT